MIEEDAPAKPPAFQIGQALDLLSVEEINDTVELLTAEIERLNAAAMSKAAHLNAADALFKKN